MSILELRNVTAVKNKAVCRLMNSLKLAVATFLTVCLVFLHIGGASAAGLGSASYAVSTSGVGGASALKSPLAEVVLNGSILQVTPNRVVYYQTNGALRSVGLNAATPVTVELLSSGVSKSATFFNAALAGATGKLVQCSAGAVQILNIASKETFVVAGSGLGGDSGDGGSAMAAGFSCSAVVVVPSDVAGILGSAGIYIADRVANRIRKVDLLTGLISTVVGTGVAGYSGDGGLGTQATIRSPNRIVADNLGGIYFASYLGNDQVNTNDTIRRLDLATGIVSTIGGGGAGSHAIPSSKDGAAFNNVLATSIAMWPAISLTVDPATGDVYRGSGHINDIAKIDATTGNIIRIAGNGKRLVNDMTGAVGGLAPALGVGLTPWGITFGLDGKLYVMDNNKFLRGISPGAAGGVIDGTAQIEPVQLGRVANGDGGPFVYATGVASFGVAMVPAGVADAGAMILSGSEDGLIRMVAPDVNGMISPESIITLIAGSTRAFTYAESTAGNAGPANQAKLSRAVMGIDLDAKGNLYVADWHFGSVRKIAVHPATNPATGVADPQAGKLDGNSIITEVAKGSKGVLSALVIDRPNNILYFSANARTVSKVDLATGVFTENFLGGAGSSTVTTGMLAGQPYAASQLIGFAGSLAVDRMGKLYIATQSTQSIEVYDPVAPAGQEITLLAGGVAPNYTFSGAGGPVGMARILFPKALNIDPTTGDLIFSQANNIWSNLSVLGDANPGMLRIINTGTLTNPVIDRNSLLMFITSGTAAGSSMLADGTLGTSNNTYLRSKAFDSFGSYQTGIGTLVNNGLKPLLFTSTSILNSAPLLTGTANPGASIKLYLDASAYQTTAADQAALTQYGPTLFADVNGNWSYQIPANAPLSLGKHRIRIIAESLDSRVNPPKVTAQSRFDVISIFQVVASLETAQQPVILTASGLTVKQVFISGISPNLGSEILVYLDGKPIGGVIVNPLIVDSVINGITQYQWTFSPSVSQGLNGSVSISALEKTVSGVNSLLTTPITQTIDSQPPVITLSGSAVTQIGSNVLYVDSGALAIDGLDGNITASIVTNSSLPTTLPLTPGSYTVSYTVNDAAGNMGSAIRTVIVQDTTPPAAPVINNPGALTLSAGTVSFTGAATAGDLVELRVQGRSLGMATLTGAAWALTAPSSLFTNGSNVLSAIATDAAGNTSPVALMVVVVTDVASPAIPTIASPAANAILTMFTPALSGTADPGVTIVVSDINGVQVAVATADFSGAWAAVTSTLNSALTTLNVSARDGAGNVSQTASVSFTLPATDTIPPLSPTITGGHRRVTNLLANTENMAAASWSKLRVGQGLPPVVTVNDIGILDPKGLNEAARIVFNTTAVGGNWSYIRAPVPASNATKKAVAVWLKSNDSVSHVLFLGVAQGTWSPITITPTWQKFFISNPAVPTQGIFFLIATGNTTGAGVADIAMWHPQFEEDSNSAIALPSIYVLNGPSADGLTSSSGTTQSNLRVTDTLLAGKIVNVGTPQIVTIPSWPVIDGKAEPGSLVKLYDSTQAPKLLGESRASSAGLWSMDFANSALPAGNISLSASATDAAANVSVLSLPVVAVVSGAAIAPPGSPVVAAIASTIYASSMTIQGVAEAGSLVEIKNQNAVVGSLQLSAGASNWSIVLNGLSDGVHKLNITAANVAGASPINQVSFEVLSALSNTLISLPGAQVAGQVVSVSGLAFPGSVIDLQQAGVSVLSASAVVNARGEWQANFSTPVVAIGQHVFSVVTTLPGSGLARRLNTYSFNINSVIIPLVTPAADIYIESTGAVLASVALGSATALDSLGVALTGANAPVAIFNGVVISTGTLSNLRVGNYVVQWSATDPNSGLTGHAIQVVHVVDTTVPAVTPPAAVTIAAGGTTALGAATALDTVDGAITPVATLNGVAVPSTLPSGIYTVTWSATDSAGNKGTATQLLTVSADAIPPIIAALAYSAEATSASTAVSGSAFGVTVTDNVDTGLVAISTTVQIPSASYGGVIPVTWTAIDLAGNSSTVVQNVTINDTTPPTLTLYGQSVITVNAHATNVYVDTGAVASDLVDGTVAPSMTVAGPNAATAVSLAVPGVYTVTYAATDAAGNVATTVSRTVNVVDNVAPTLTFASGTPAGLVQQATVFTPPVVNAGDNLDAVTAVAPVVTGAGTVEILAADVLAGNGTAVAGTYTYTYNHTDAAGNAAAPLVVQYVVYATVIPTDIIAPAVTAPANIAVEATSGLGIPNTAAAVTTFLGAASATDASGVVTVADNAPATFPIGATVVLFTSSDPSGNTGTAAATVTVQDSTPPAYVGATTVVFGQDSLKPAFTDTPPTLTDLVSGVLTPFKKRNSAVVDTSRLGSYFIYYTGADLRGNSAGQFVREVQVRDKTAPTVAATTAAIIDARAGRYDPDYGSASVTDNINQGLNATRVLKDSTGAVVAAGTALVPGTYTAEWTAADPVGTYSDALSTTVIKSFTVNAVSKTHNLIKNVAGTTSVSVIGYNLVDPAITTAKQLWASTPNIDQLSRWDAVTQTVISYQQLPNGTVIANNFTLSPGDAYFVSVTAPSTFTVGATLPAQPLVNALIKNANGLSSVNAITLRKGRVGSAKVTGNGNLVNASDLAADNPNSDGISHWDVATQSFVSLVLNPVTGAPIVDFPLVDGEPVFMSVSTSSTY